MHGGTLNARRRASRARLRRLSEELDTRRRAREGFNLALTEVRMADRENESAVGEVEVCQVCGEKYASRELLSQHMLEEHADDD